MAEDVTRMPGSIAVVIPTFNRPQLLPETIRSALGQSRSPAQVVVVNDGGPVDPRDFLGDLLADPRLSVINRPNGGTASARNAGAAASTSDYLLFLDDDDHLLPNALAGLGALLDDGPWIAASGGAEIMGQPPGAEPWWLPPIVPQGMYFDTVLRGSPFPASAVLMRRSALAKVGGYREQIRSIDDYDLWLRLSCTGPIAALQEPVLLYRIHGGNLSKAPIQLKYAAEVAKEAVRLGGAKGREAGIAVRRYLMRAHLDDLFWSIRGDVRERRLTDAVKGLALSLRPVLEPAPSPSLLREWWTIAAANFGWKPKPS